MSTAAPAAPAPHAPDAVPHAIGHREPIGNLIPSPLNPRTRFTPADLADLQANVSRMHRVLSPLLARPAKGKPGKFEIIDGERRWRCAGVAQLAEVPIVVEDLSDADALEIMLISAVLAQALTPLEEAEAFKKLVTLGKGQHTLQTVGQKLGKDAKWVANRIRLTELIPDAKDALRAGAIEVGHADILARQTPTWQKKLLALPTGYYHTKGLWERKGEVLEFDDAPPKTKWDKVRAVSVREFESYVKTHIRFDAEHAAATQPLEYADTKQAIDQAQQRQKRGNKVVPISFERQLTMDARDKDGEHTYCRESWRKVGAKPCEKSVLGVVAAGEPYGRSFEVCVNKDCTVHWPAEAKQRAARKKEADRRATGAPAKGEKAEKAESPEAKAKREAAEKKAERENELKVARMLETARRGIVQIVSSLKRLDGPILALLADEATRGAEDCDQELIDLVSDDLGLDGACFEWRGREKALARLKGDALVRTMIAGLLFSKCEFYGRSAELEPSFVEVCKKLGVDLKQIDAEVAKEQAAKEAAANKPKAAAPAKPAKKAKKR